MIKQILFVSLLVKLNLFSMSNDISQLSIDELERKIKTEKILKSCTDSGVCIGIGFSILMGLSFLNSLHNGYIGSSCVDGTCFAGMMYNTKKIIDLRNRQLKTEKMLSDELNRRTSDRIAYYLNKNLANLSELTD